MKVIGLTGGIGSGKSTVAGMFTELGIPVFITDNEGRRLLNSSKVVKRKVIELLGENSYDKTIPNRKYIALKVFNDKELLTSLNAIIHPKVAKSFTRWQAKQDSYYCIKESAILFETGGDLICDATITVEVALETRIARVLKRDAMSLKEVEARLRNQKSDAYRNSKATYVIKNDTLAVTKEQVHRLHKSLLSLK